MKAEGLRYRCKRAWVGRTVECLVKDIRLLSKTAWIVEGVNARKKVEGLRSLETPKRH